MKEPIYLSAAPDYPFLLRAMPYVKTHNKEACWEIEALSRGGWRCLKVNGQVQRCVTAKQARKRMKLIVKNHLYPYESEYDYAR